MNTFSARRSELFIRVAKLLAYFILYQFVFVTLGSVLAYLCYFVSVEPVGYSVFTGLPAAATVSYRAGGAGVGMLLSGVAMIAHLLFFKYVHIRRGFLREVKCSVLFLSIAFIMCAMVVFNIVAVWLGLENNMQQEMELVLKSSAGLLSVAVVAPALEELLFRGAIQGLLMRFFKNPWVGIFVAAFLFGIIHLNPVQVFYATCLGMVFGWVYYRTGSLLPAIVGHIINNSLALCSMIIWGESNEFEEAAGVVGEVSMVVFFSLLAMLVAWGINARQPAVPKPWHEAGCR